MKKILISFAIAAAILLGGCGSDGPEVPPAPLDPAVSPSDSTRQLPEIHNDDGNAEWVWTTHPSTGETVWCIVYGKDHYGTGFDCLSTSAPSNASEAPR